MKYFPCNKLLIRIILSQTSISGNGKMTLLHHIHHYGKIRFNETKKTLGVSEKVLSQQLKELTHDGLVERIQYNTIPLKVEYILTPLGEDLIPALDILYIWSIRRLNELNLPLIQMPLQFTQKSNIVTNYKISWIRI